MISQVLPLLKTGTQAWQPSDFLPASNDPDFEDKVRQRQGHAGVAVLHPNRLHCSCGACQDVQQP